MNNSIWGGTRNGDHHQNARLYKAAQLESVGFDKKSEERQPRFNGGVTAPREIRLQRGDKIYRFCGSKDKNLEQQIRGRWWFDYDACLFLQSKSGGTDKGFRNAARAAFAVVPEWSDMNFCTSGLLAYDFWAIAGNTARAVGKSASANNPYGISICQIFIPGGLTPADFTEVQPVAITRVAY